MSSVITTPFTIQQTSDGRFVVNLDNNLVTVQTRQEADLLASLSVEHSKTYTDIPGAPDAIRVRRILTICKRYGYRSAAVGQLESWLSTDPVCRESFHRLIDSALKQGGSIHKHKNHFRTDEVAT